MNNNPKPWDRKLWSVTLTPKYGKPLFISSTFQWTSAEDGIPHKWCEPRRVLLFQNRRSARAWIQEKIPWDKRKPYRVVRVRELVEVI